MLDEEIMPQGIFSNTFGNGVFVFGICIQVHSNTVLGCINIWIIPFIINNVFWLVFEYLSIVFVLSE